MVGNSFHFFINRFTASFKTLILLVYIADDIMQSFLTVITSIIVIAYVQCITVNLEQLQDNRRVQKSVE